MEVVAVAWTERTGGEHWRVRYRSNGSVRSRAGAAVGHPRLAFVPPVKDEMAVQLCVAPD